MSKYTQRTPHYVDHVGHGLARPARGWAPVFLNGSGVQLARGANGFWCTAVAVDFEDPNKVGVIFDGVIYTPSTPVTSRVTLFVGATAGAVTTTKAPAYQAIGQVVDAHHTAVQIHAPVTTPTSTFHGVALPAADTFEGNVFWLEADDGPFTRGLYASDGTQRHRFADVP